MYGDDDGEFQRPLSFTETPYGGEQIDKTQMRRQHGHPDERQRLVRSQSSYNTSGAPSTVANKPGSDGPRPSEANGSFKKSQTMPARMPSKRTNSHEAKGPLPPISPISPLSPSLRDTSSQFPMSDMENPSEIAQELSNLQALRRMSMDVGNNSDPDLLPFSGLSLMAIPAIAPSGDDNEADPSRLLWVPASVHPELEPSAFKNFLEDRVQVMKRRSGDSLLSTSSLGSLDRRDSGGLRRKKSMLSRQINHRESDSYVDGADRLGRKHSLAEQPMPELPELDLDELVKDPSKVVKKLAEETRQEADEGDMPILPVAPGTGLRRSTKTTYRKAGSLRGDRVPFSKRVAARQAEKDEEDMPKPPAIETPPATETPPGHSLQRVRSEASTENYSRPTRSVRRQQNFLRESAPTSQEDDAVQVSSREANLPATKNNAPIAHPQQPTRADSSLSLRSTTTPAIPLIVETPPLADVTQSSHQYPARSSSQHTVQPNHGEQSSLDRTPSRLPMKPAAGNRPSLSPTSPTAHQLSAQEQSSPTSTSSLNDMANNPSPLPGSGAIRTDSLTFIPTYPSPEDKKAEKRVSKERDDNESVLSTKSSSGWKWFKSEKDKKKKEKEREEERGKERDRSRDREEEQAQAKKLVKGKDKANDNARLDMLQSSIENAATKGRESLLLDRDSIDNKLTEDRKKDNVRKPSEGKKEKDGFFGGLFGGSKKKGDKDQAGRKSKDLRPATPEPPARKLVADVDYAWTRFPIIEERAIYRMAHLKLANPRRSLQSQVLLSNFMYSYLAKVQAMHPHIQVPVSPQQKKLEEERKRQEAEQAQQLAEQRAVQDGNYNFEYHRVSH